MYRPATFQRLTVGSQVSSLTPCLTNSSHLSNPKAGLLPPQLSKMAILCLYFTFPSWGLEATLRTLFGPSGTLSDDSRTMQHMLGNRSKAPSRMWPCVCSIHVILWTLERYSWEEGGLGHRLLFLWPLLNQWRNWGPEKARGLSNSLMGN